MLRCQKLPELTYFLFIFLIQVETLICLSNPFHRQI